MNRYVRIFLCAFAAMCVTAVSIWVGLYLVDKQSTGVAVSWHAFLVCVIALSFAWAVLLSQPEGSAVPERDLLSVITRGLLWMFGLMAYSVTLADGSPSKDQLILSSVLFAAALLAIPWGYDKYNKIMSSYEGADIQS